MLEDDCFLLLEDGERRVGDPAILVADATQAKQVLNWQPEYADLETIIRHAWTWEKKISFWVVNMFCVFFKKDQCIKGIG